MPADTPGHAARARDAAIRRTIAVTLGARVVSVACTLVQVPLALHYLGTEAYGLWIALTSATLLLNVADLGLGAGMQNEIGTALGRDERRRAAALFFTTTVLLAAIGIVLAAVGSAVALRINWGAVFHLTDPALASVAPHAAVATVLLFCAGLPFTAAARLANACQWGWLSGAWAAGASGAQLAVVLCAARLHLGFVSFVALAGLAPVAALVALLIHAVRRLRWTAADLTWAGADDRRTLIRGGLHFSLLQIGATFLFNAAAPMIGAVAGSSAVAAYSVLQRLLGLFPQLQQIAIAPTWPGYTDAAARGDMAWIRRTYRWSLLATVFGVGVPLAVTALLTPAIVHVWTRASALPIGAGLIATVALWNFVICLGHAPSHLLGGLGRVGRLAWFSFAGNVVSAAGMVLAGRAWGAPGVIAGLLAGTVALGLPVAFLEARAALASAAVRP